jgi:MerR family copper efflux transcriptional regulator
MAPLHIGRLARLANVNVQTVRFYERKGLLPRPARRLSGYREFTHKDIGIIRFIKDFQGLGFSLKEIKEILTRRKMSSATMGAACERLESKINELDAQIEELVATRRTLTQIVEHHRSGPDIPFAELFDKHIEKLFNEALASESPQRPKTRDAPERRKKK